MYKYSKRLDVVRRRPISSRLGVVFSLLATIPTVAIAQSGPTPTYIDTLATFEVRRLDGAYAPSNGNETMVDVTPAEWLNNDPSVFGLAGVIVAWSGGAKSVGTEMFVHGGGHADGANNGMYIYDFSGAANPTGWQSPLVISDVSDVRADVKAYADGKPNSVHTYDGVVYASHNNHVYRFGGSPWVSGGLTNAAFKYNVDTGQWTQLPDYPGGQGAAKTIYDPQTGNIFVTMTNSTEGYFLRTNNDSWSGRKQYGGNGFPFDSMAAWDTRRSRAIIVGEGESSVVDINFAAETVSVQSFNPSGATEMYSRSGISAVYDPVRDVYWLFAGPLNSPGYNNIYELRAAGSPWTTTRHSLSGDTIPQRASTIGSWGRFVLMPQWGAIGLVASETSPALVIKLPNGDVSTPNPPDDLVAN